MNLQSQMQALAVQGLHIGVPSKMQEQRQPQQPSPRRFHSAVIHKSSLFVYGGLLDGSTDQPNEQCTVYRYNFASKIWSRHQTHFLNNTSFSNVYAHSTAVYNNMMYLYGGKDYLSDQHILGLWCLNLESYNWKRQQIKGYSPLQRQFATMVLHQRSSIFMYGGRFQKQNLNDFNIYRIENKQWLKIEEASYDLKIPCRLRPAICSQGDHLFFFGGQRMQLTEEGDTENVLLKDFYQIKVINRPMSSRPDLWVKSIITNYSPTQRVANVVNVADKYLMLWGGNNQHEKSQPSQLGFWLYSIADINWHWVTLKQSPKVQPRYGFSLNYVNEKCFLFGSFQAIPDQKKPQKNNSGFLTINLDLKEIELKLNHNDYRPQILAGTKEECWQCNEQAKNISHPKFNQFTLLRQTLDDNMGLVYSGFGLLIDNALSLGAKQAKVLFNHTFKEKYILIEDNSNTSKTWPNSQEFINDMLVIRTYVEENIDQLDSQPQDQITKKSYIPQNNIPHLPVTILNTKETRQQRQQKEREAKDKEMERELKKRKRIAKEAAKKKKEDRIEYSRNIKLGALRIGDKFIFITRYGSSFDNRRVFVVEKVSSTPLEISYRAYYYVYENGALTDPNMDTAKKYIDQEYKAYFKVVNDRKDQANNFVFIAGLREIENEKGEFQPQLKESNRHNDIFCCQKKILQTLQDSVLWDSIDISLKNYLSMLYLKSDQLKISLGINDHRVVEINNSDFFDKIDSLVKSERLIDLLPALDLSNCNIIEVYYNKTSGRARQLNRKSTTINFLNGVLFYRKNRLISRYKYNFGEVNKLYKYKPKVIQQMLMMFGFIEIQTEFAVNIFKTAFVRDDLLEEIHHRLKFVEKYADEKLNKDKDNPISRRQSQEKHEPRKRFRGNDEGRQQAKERERQSAA